MTAEVHQRKLDKIPKPSATRQCEQEQGEWLDQWGEDRHLGLFCPETGLTIWERRPRGILTNLQGYGDSNRVNLLFRLAPKAAP